MATTTEHDYVLGRTEAEYERLIGQARWWEPETARVLDRVGVRPGARCLDAGCGPGEAMRLLAERAGPDSYVLGIDVDAELGRRSLTRLHAGGYDQCAFACVDVQADDPVPGAPFDIVYARLLLLHVDDTVAVLQRLWDCVAAGGQLIVHDHDLLTAEAVPPLDTVDEFLRIVRGTFHRAGRDLRLGLRLAKLFAAAGIGTPDGMDAAARVDVLPNLAPMYEDVFRSVLPAAVALGVTTPERGERWLIDFARESITAHEHAALWPLLVAAHKRKETTS
jgi:ubiquinone/menaquinone biosynthesis C-methylase UbiE